MTGHDIVRHGQVRVVHSRSNGDDVDATGLLEDDHKIVEKLFKRFEKAAG